MPTKEKTKRGKRVPVEKKNKVREEYSDYADNG